ncbi:MAG: sulfatase-like hydrolase/transferase [Gemmatimonadota bacterium]|nr:sulfatase-like hydrolase/transferase [Gemmatimonadota bacterium]
MTKTTVARRGASWLWENWPDFARTSVGFLPVLLVVRAYERLLAGATQALPAGSPAGWARTAVSDIALCLWVAALLAIPVLVLARWSPAAARAAHRVALVLIAMLGAALAQYFAVTRVPLGADLYGYSWQDIRETVGASQGVGVGAIIATLVLGAVAWTLPTFARRVPWSRTASVGFALSVVGVVAVPALLVPPAAAFPSSASHLLAVNKTGWLAQRSVQHLTSHWQLERASRALSGYPLMHPVAYDDVLGPRFALPAQPPNIVFIVVEGLGRDFTGPGAVYGGFTPFLDSLADRSLSWDNFLSTSGRTFGVLPSLLGSLPFGETGFMELGARMPAHATLATLLQPYGYETNYFTGTNGQFDRIDLFMERQGVSRFMDASGFAPGTPQLPAPPGGESWGYADGVLYDRSLELLSATRPAPRIDVYLTITTHEPFIPPDAPRYRARFDRRLTELRTDGARAAELRANAGIFQTLLYADDALRAFVARYATRADYARTIFVVTGDHRLIPMASDNRLARYHVPFIIYSPMLRAPQHIAAVSSHFDVLPSLLAMLKARYGFALPDSAPWIGAGLDTARRFRHAHALPLMRTKNELDEYVNGARFLSGGEIYAIDSTLGVSRVRDAAARETAVAALDQFRAVNHYATASNHVVPLSGAGVTPPPDLAAMARDDSVVTALGLDGRTPDDAFRVARDRAAAREYDAARAICRRLLRDAPSYHDARALLGRTYAWGQQYDEARRIIDDLVRRAPWYADGLAAQVQLDIYQGRTEAAMAGSARALAQFPRDPGLLYFRARALELGAQRAEALAVLDTLRRVDPRYEGADDLRRRLSTP